MHRWAHLLKQQSSITIYRLLTKENKLPFSANKRKFAVFVFHLQQTNWSCFFPLVSFPFVVFQKHGDGHMEKWRHGEMESWRQEDMEMENRKLKPRWFSLIHLPFTHHTTRSLFSVHLLMKKLTVYKRTKQTTLTCLSMAIWGRYSSPSVCIVTS